MAKCECCGKGGEIAPEQFMTGIKNMLTMMLKDRKSVV